MSSDRWWWARKAHELRFSQLDAARRQAETWRTGLTGLTALLGAVLVVKGRENVTDLPAPYRLTVLALFVLALAALVTATFRALRAASGVPGDECLLTGEDLEAWTRREVTEVYRAVTAARWLTVTGICAVVAAVGTAWIAPTERPRVPTVEVVSPDGRFCGELQRIGDGYLQIGRDRSYHLVPLTSVIRVDEVASCTG